nr:hypothetical protein GCM10020241_25740 [Streptoalloteichus tenebrarius]
MAYDRVIRAAYVPNPDAGPFVLRCHALAFPARWREPLLELFRYGKKKNPEKFRQVPIARLNALLRAVAPDLISVGAKAALDEERPWLYTTNPYPLPVLTSLINAYLWDMQPNPEAFSHLERTAQSLDLDSLTWKPIEVDLWAHEVSPGGTCVPADHLYRLLPEILASRIAQLPPYEYCGEKVQFVQVAPLGQDNGAELMSWPPLSHTTKTKDGDRREWNYSGVIRISLRTSPFSPVPRIHLSAGVRRWRRGPVWMPAKGGVSTYLRTRTPLVPGAPTPTRFAVAQLTWIPEVGVRWRHGGPQGMLDRLSVVDNLPSPEVLAKEAERWMDGLDGFQAAVVHHTMMGPHGVGAGLMPSERVRLLEWAAQALEPDLVRIADLRRSALTSRGPHKVVEPRLPVKKKATDEQRTEIEARNEEIDRRNANARRASVAAAVGKQGLRVRLLHQTDRTRDAIIAAAERSLNLGEFRRETGSTTWSWEAPDLTVHIHVDPLGGLGAPLGTGDKAPKRGEETDAAIAKRRREVAAALDELAQQTPPAPHLVIVELDGKDKFSARRTDPKHAIRLGCADAGCVSQFIRTPGTDEEEEDDLAHRAAAAWDDGLRQVGVRFVPVHSLDDAIPTNLNQLAFWLVKRRSNDQFGPQFTPVAILIRPCQNQIMGRTPDLDAWIPYPDLLRALTGEVRDENLATEQQQRDVTAAFVRHTLYHLRGEPTLVLTHAQNMRYRWSWLTNPGLVADRIQIGDGRLQQLRTHGKHLRIVRVATGARHETPQWWAEKSKEEGGISKGLWVPEDAGDHGRVFYSTVEKASTHTLSVDATKLTHRLNAKGKLEIKPGKNAWNPDLLEFAMAGPPAQR